MSIVFITGGSCAGKEAYARKMFPESEVIAGYHRAVRKQMEAGLDPIAEVCRFLKDTERRTDGVPLVITSDEVGCGIVPMEAFEREYREMNGRVSCVLAEHAAEVYRVICGVGNRIR